MPKTKISEFSSTPGNNTDIDGINIAEGCAPSGINDAIRELMSQLKDFQAGTAGDSFNGPVGTTTAAAGAFTTLSASGAVTLSGGTANGVPYLNGSKVLTTGSALTFDGSALALDTSTTSDALRITQRGTGNVLLVEDSTNPDSTPFVINASGQTVIGYTVPVLNSLSAVAPTFQIHGIGAGPAAASITSWATGGAVGARLLLSRSEGGVVGTQTIVDNGDMMGYLGFTASDGTGFIEGARIVAEVDGTPGTNDMPGRLIFSTTADGASTPTERMRLNSSGNLGLGVTPSAWEASAALQVTNNYSYSKYGMGRNYYYDGSSNRYITSAAAGTYQISGGGAHVWSIAPSGTAGNAISFTQAMTLDASGNLGIGTTSPGSRLDVAGTISSVNGYQDNLVLQNALSGSRNRFILGQSLTNGAYIYTDAPGGVASPLPLTFWTAGTERARIDSSGNLLVGTTSQVGFNGGAGANINANGAFRNGVSGSGDSSAWQRSSTGNYLAFFYGALNTNPTGVGSINTNGTSTTYSTSSDYRLKHDIQPMTGALAKVAALKPVTYKWKVDGSDGEGFIAHELAEVCPDAVTGEKDAVDADGNPKYQGIDTSFLVATLTAAIQEQQAMIQQLQAEVAALKGN